MFKVRQAIVVVLVVMMVMMVMKMFEVRLLLGCSRWGMWL